MIRNYSVLFRACVRQHLDASMRQIDDDVYQSEMICGMQFFFL